MPMLLAVALMTCDAPHRSNEILNPIDCFFARFEREFDIDFDASTMSMMLHATLVGTAWHNEMVNFAEILASMAANDYVREVLYNEIYHFRQTLQYRAEIEAMIDASNAFGSSNDELSFGSLAMVTRNWSIARGYRDKALDLLVRLQRLHGTNQTSNPYDFSFFSFCEEDFMAWVEEMLPGLRAYP